MGYWAADCLQNTLDGSGCSTWTAESPEGHQGREAQAPLSEQKRPDGIHKLGFSCHWIELDEVFLETEEQLQKLQDGNQRWCQWVKLME